VATLPLFVHAATSLSLILRGGLVTQTNNLSLLHTVLRESRCDFHMSYTICLLDTQQFLSTRLDTHLKTCCHRCFPAATPRSKFHRPSFFHSHGSISIPGSVRLECQVCYGGNRAQVVGESQPSLGHIPQSEFVEPKSEINYFWTNKPFHSSYKIAYCFKPDH
jgi:hypothetical protein